MWCKIDRIEDSMINNSQIVYFEYLGQIKSIVVSQKVLNFLSIPVIDGIEEIFVTKTFNKENKEIFVIKKVK